MTEWIKIDLRRGPWPADWQEVLIAWDRPRRFKFLPRVQGVTFRDHKDGGCKMFGDQAAASDNPWRPTHWAVMPEPPNRARKA